MTISSGVGANVPRVVGALDLMQHVIFPTLPIDGARGVIEMAPGNCKGQPNLVENRLTLDVLFLSVLTSNQACNRPPTAIIFLGE